MQVSLSARKDLSSFSGVGCPMTAPHCARRCQRLAYFSGRRNPADVKPSNSSKRRLPRYVVSAEITSLCYEPRVALVPMQQSSSKVMLRTAHGSIMHCAEQISGGFSTNLHSGEGHGREYPAHQRGKWRQKEVSSFANSAFFDVSRSYGGLNILLIDCFSFAIVHNFSYWLTLQVTTSCTFRPSGCEPWDAVIRLQSDVTCFIAMSQHRGGK